MPAAEVIASYHDLWHVEQSFRMSKTDLAARPMFPHTREAIEAHLTIAFAALRDCPPPAERRRAEHKKVIQALRPIQQITVLIAGHEHVAEDPTTPVAEAILDTLGFSSVTPPVARVRPESRTVIDEQPFPTTTAGVSRACG